MTEFILHALPATGFPHSLGHLACLPERNLIPARWFQLSMATLTKHPNFSDLKQRQYVIFYNSVVEEFRQGSAGQVFCSTWRGLGLLIRLRLAGGWAGLDGPRTCPCPCVLYVVPFFSLLSSLA